MPGYLMMFACQRIVQQFGGDDDDEQIKCGHMRLDLKPNMPNIK